MITLYQNSANTTYLTLSDSITLTSNTVYFLFRFTDETTLSDLYFTAPDTSTNTLRYNSFNITLTGSASTNLTAGTIYLRPDGRYIYQVYEQLSQTNLNLTGTSGTVLEQGIVQVKGTNLNAISTFYSGQSATYNYYEPS